MRGVVSVALLALAALIGSVYASKASPAPSMVYYNTTNAVSGCGDSCQNNGPFVCLGGPISFAACQAACAQHPYCNVMTWSSMSGNCWTRLDNVWETVYQSGITSGCNPTLIPNCVSVPPVSSPISARIFTGTVLGTTHPLSPAVTLDFWRWDDPNFGEKWMNSSAIEIDLTNPRLRALATAIAPALLRIGGSPEDSIIFDADGSCVPMSGGNGTAPDGYYCSQVHPYSYDCLTPARWNALLEFAHSTGLKIALGLNGCYGRQSPTSLMDLSNVKALMQATVASPYVKALWGFEFTNEVVPNTIAPAAWAADMTAIKVLASDLFTAAGLPVPGIAGPAQGGCDALGSVAQALSPGVVDAYTYHQYPECTAPSPPDGYVFDTACLMQLDTQAAQCVATALNDSAPDWPTPPTWAGETADHSGGGIANLTDTFRSSFYYAWQLGALPTWGVALAARQCLSGGDYELLQRGTFEPNPDYFIIWLFRALIGGNATAYAVTQNVTYQSSGVRLFAFSAAPATNGSATILIINLQSGGNATAITLGGNALNQPRVEYHLTGDVTLEHGPIACNGVPLVLNPNTNLPPAWQSLGVKRTGGSTLMMAPASIAFVTVM